MFEINLVKDRVVPMSHKILRTFIVTAYYTIVLFATLVIMIMSFGVESKIAQNLEDYRNLEKDFITHKEDQERYDTNFARGTRIYQENEILKAPWLKRVNFPFIFDALCEKWKKPELSKFASITSVSFDSDFQYDPNSYSAENDNYDKIFIYGNFYDDPNRPGGIKGSFNRIREYTDKQLEDLRNELLKDQKFTELTNISNIEVESNPNGYFEDDKPDSSVICYFKITMTAAGPMIPRPEIVEKDPKKKP